MFIESWKQIVIWQAGYLTELFANAKEKEFLLFGKKVVKQMKKFLLIQSDVLRSSLNNNTAVLFMYSKNLPC
jgi:hypothetical protein